MSDLNFSDRLNVGLFILTIMSIVLAGWGIYIARVTLHEAQAATATQDTQFKQQQTESALASAHEDDQFKTQMGELKKQNQQLDDSGKLLIRTTRALSTQTRLLTGISYTAQKQLDELHAAELRATAQPEPNLLMSCGWTYILNSQEEAENTAASLGANPQKIKDVSKPWDLDQDGTGTMSCSIRLTNAGKGNLHIHRMFVWIRPGTCKFTDPTTSSDETKSGVLISGPDGKPENQIELLSDSNLPSNEHWAYERDFTILRINKNCQKFLLVVRLESNGPGAALHANINTQQ